MPPTLDTVNHEALTDVHKYPHISQFSSPRRSAWDARMQRNSIKKLAAVMSTQVDTLKPLDVFYLWLSLWKNASHPRPLWRKLKLADDVKVWLWLTTPRGECWAGMFATLLNHNNFMDSFLKTAKSELQRYDNITALNRLSFNKYLAFITVISSLVHFIQLIKLQTLRGKIW